MVSDAGPEDEIADIKAKKAGEVLEREGVEQELMQKDVSEVGEELDNVQDAAPGE